MLSTMKVLGQIEQDFKKSKPLQGYLPSLISSLQSTKKVHLSNMNGKQKLSQLQALIENEMKSINLTLGQMNINLQDDVEDDNIGIEQEEEIEDEMVDEEGEGEQGDDGEMEVEEGDEEFIQPEFGDDGQHQQPEQQQQMMYNQQQLYHSADDNDSNPNSQQPSQQLSSSQADVGLYGQQLNQNDQDFQAYANQFDEEQFKQFQKQFGQKENKKDKKDKRKKLKDGEEEEEDGDEYVDDNFDHFREVEMENRKQQEQQEEEGKLEVVKQQKKTDLDNQIDRLQNKVFGKKDWTMRGQIKARQRPANSLLQYDLQFNSGVKFSHQITEQRNTQLEQLIKKRVLNDMFDDRTRFVNTNHIREHFGSLKEVSREKSQMGLGEVYEAQFKNFLGIGDNKNDKLKAEIMDSFKQLNYFLDSLSNFSFVPKPTKDNTKKGQSEAIIVQQKVPLTLWNGQREVQKDGKMTFQSEKEVDNQAKRLKNKRIARQRKKQQMKKKLNKVIEYGGITKFEAQAKKKAQMNNKPLKIDGVNMKYNKSSSFFKNINNSTKAGKPNPDISKMKI